MPSMAAKSISGKSRVHRRADLPFKGFAREAMVLDMSSGNFFEMDELGHFVWRLLDGKRDLDQIAGMIASKYDVSRATALKDLMSFVKRLEKWELASRTGS